MGVKVKPPNPPLWVRHAQPPYFKTHCHGTINLLLVSEQQKSRKKCVSL